MSTRVTPDEVLRALGNVLDAYDGCRSTDGGQTPLDEMHVAEARKILALAKEQTAPPAPRTCIYCDPMLPHAASHPVLPVCLDCDLERIQKGYSSQDVKEHAAGPRIPIALRPVSVHGGSKRRGHPR